MYLKELVKVKCPFQAHSEPNAHPSLTILSYMSPSGHGVVSIPIRVLYSHAGPVGTTEDLSSQTTKSSDHVKDQVI